MKKLSIPFFLAPLRWVSLTACPHCLFIITYKVMSTILFDKTIFGPVHSRRLGVSLGVNLLPVDRKLCSFDCLYCECGFNKKAEEGKAVLPSRSEVRQLLEEKLTEMKAEGVLPDVITFAGNGEPTLHPDFEGVVTDTIELRNAFAPKAKIAVLSNASRLSSEAVCRALAKVDDNILKIDAGPEELVVRLDRPVYKYSLSQTAEQISQFGSNLVVQTMFCQWKQDGVEYDNATDECVEEWLKMIARINPPRVMIYTIDRETPLHGMQKTSATRLDEIAQRARAIVGNVSVSY